MKTKRLMGAVLGLFCLLFCSSCSMFGIELPGRVTTPDERAESLDALDEASLAVDVAELAGLEAQKAAKVRGAIAELRLIVEESENSPVSLTNVVRWALRLWMQWSTADDAKPAAAAPEVEARSAPAES